ncbi:MAG: hypothetical protein K0B09_02480 [Bacteroidales bacterium]|nr:hypothetical protein [Bacteroidales bacterium]
MKKLLPLFFILFLGLASCQKDPSTLPAKIKFNFGMTPLSAGEGLKDASVNTDQSGQVYLTMDGGTLVVSTIEFEGRRQDASDVFFTADFDPPIVVDLETETMNRLVQFDIPQGIYERIELKFHLGASGQLPLVMTGEANLPIFGQKPVRFEYQYSEPVRVVAQSSTGGNIVLKKDVPGTATVDVNASHLFRLVNVGLLVSSELHNENGGEIILINQDMNSPIFNVIANRLSQSFEVIFE